MRRLDFIKSLLVAPLALVGIKPKCGSASDKQFPLSGIGCTGDADGTRRSWVSVRVYGDKIHSATGIADRLYRGAAFFDHWTQIAKDRLNELIREHGAVHVCHGEQDVSHVIDRGACCFVDEAGGENRWKLYVEVGCTCNVDSNVKPYAAWTSSFEQCKVS